MRFVAFLLISLGLHVWLVVASMFSVRPAVPLLRYGESCVKFQLSPASAPSVRVEAYSPTQADQVSPVPAKEIAEWAPAEPAPQVIPQQPDRPLVLPAPHVPLTSGWQSEFATWSNDRSFLAPQRAAVADLRIPASSPPRDRNTTTVTARSTAAIPLRDLVTKTTRSTPTKPPANAQAKPSPSKLETVAKQEGTPSPGSVASAPSENQARGVRTDARMLGSVYPPYPLEGRRLGVEGRVVLAFRVTERGEVVEPRVKETSGHAILDEAALEFIRQVRYQPARLGTQVLSTEEYLAIRYRLY